MLGEFGSGSLPYTPLTYAAAAGLRNEAGIGVFAGRRNWPVQLFSPRAGRLIQTGFGKIPFRRFVSGTVTVCADVNRLSFLHSCEKKKNVRSSLLTIEPPGSPSPKLKK